MSPSLRMQSGLEGSGGTFHPQAPQRAGEARAGLVVRTLELREAGYEQLDISERDEGPLQTRAPEEPHRGRLQSLGILTGDQHEQRGRLVETDVRELRSGRSRSQDVSTCERSAKPGERRSLRCHEHMFAPRRESGARSGDRARSAGAHASGISALLPPAGLARPVENPMRSARMRGRERTIACPTAC
jgi:hypothetical protein